MSSFVLRHLKGFVTPSKVDLLLKECISGKGRYFHSLEHHNAFLNEGNASGTEEERAIQNQKLTSEKLILDGEELDEESHAAELYYRLLPVVGEIVGKELFPHGDRMNRNYYNSFEVGHQLGWHFDNSAFGVNILLQNARAGGILQYGITNSVTEVGQYLSGVRPPIPVPFFPGDVIIFNGSKYLHSVSRVTDGTRINLIFCYGTSPDERLNDSTKRQFFGK
eukprot:TRINITY_DN28633_c0_g1_i1.p1 TRINITY_DN28633_c0_g1~~TRINITY_DN28633_c0_g1_i1.p1  ORF type:complete len:222 (+),score=26.46 TRINITY_DN28633_c0_g1_i1:166-831(+)